MHFRRIENNCSRRARGTCAAARPHPLDRRARVVPGERSGVTAPRHGVQPPRTLRRPAERCSASYASALTFSQLMVIARVGRCGRVSEQALGRSGHDAHIPSPIFSSPRYSRAQRGPRDRRPTARRRLSSPSLKPAPPVEPVIYTCFDDVKSLGGSGLYWNNKTHGNVVRLTK